MSRDVAFLQEGFEGEDGAVPADVIPALAATLLPLLVEEKEAIEAEVAFLKEVHFGITRGSGLENSSTVFVDIFMLNLLDNL